MSPAARSTAKCRDIEGAEIGKRDEICPAVSSPSFNALRMSRLEVAASICVLDSLSGGTSRFYAEIRKLKVAEELSAGPVPVLFLMDELLSGTNSHDRLEGTKLVVRSLMDRGAVGIVSTHDLALAEIPATMAGRAVN